MITLLILPACNDDHQSGAPASERREEPRPEVSKEEASRLSKEFLDALDKKQREEARKLLRAGADPNASFEEGDSALSIAALHGWQDIATLLLQWGADPHTVNAHGHTALWCAARSGNVALVGILIDQDVDVNFGDDTKAGPALFAAAASGHLSVVKVLIEEGADIDGRTADGQTALFAAASEAHADMADFLVAKGADPLVPVTGQTAKNSIQLAEIKWRGAQMEQMQALFGGNDSYDYTRRKIDYEHIYRLLKVSNGGEDESQVETQPDKQLNPTMKKVPALAGPESVAQVAATATLWAELENRDGIFYHSGSSETFTGWIKKVHANGKTALLGNLQKGKPNGVWTWWDENGEKEDERQN